jgi:DNA-binding transcriptional LysR family regulator
LLERTSRRVSPTPAGEELAGVLGRAFRLIDEALEKARGQAGDRARRVVVGCVPSLSSVLLPELLASYRTTDRRTRIDVEELTSTEIVDALRVERIDFGIGPCTNPPPAGIAFVAVIDEPLCVLLPADRRPCGPVPIAFSALASLPLITLSGSVLLQRHLEEVAAGQGTRLSSQSEVRHVQTAIGMVQAGVGAAIVPRLALPLVLGAGVSAFRSLSRR